MHKDQNMILCLFVAIPFLMLFFSRDSEILHVILEDTAVHNHFQARRAGASGGRLIHHPQLHPDDPRVAAYGSFDQVGNIFRAAENIDYFKGFWNVIE